MSGVKLAFPFSWPAPTLAEYRAILCSLIKHEKAEGLTHSSFHSLARCPQAVTPWHPGQRERRRPSCSQLQWITRSPRSPPPQGAWIPPSGKGIMSAWLRWLLSQKKPSFWGGGGDPPIAKAAATEKRKAAPSKTKVRGLLLSSWMGTHSCKCSAQTPLKNLMLSKLQEILEEGSGTESDLKETAYLFMPCSCKIYFGDWFPLQSFPSPPSPPHYNIQPNYHVWSMPF